jgi:predicted nucleic acid-binding protein
VRPFVLDCSVTIAWCLRDHPDKYAEGVLEALIDGEAMVPAIWQLEVVNVLRAAENRKRVTRFQSLQFLDTLKTLPIRVESPRETAPMGALLELAGRHGLTAYAAAYIEVAIRRGIPLATGDEVLRKACADAKVELFTITC